MFRRKWTKTVQTPFIRADEAQSKVEQVSNELRELTIQLNVFKPTSAQTVGEEQKVLSDKFQQQSAQQNKVYEEVQQQLGAHNVRIDQLSDSVKQSQETAQETAELMQTLLVGMENLGEHFKQLQTEMETGNLQNSKKQRGNMQNLQKIF